MISIFKIVFAAKITLISMIKKMPPTFWMLKIKVVLTYFMFVLLRPCRNAREQFQSKEGHSVDFHAILNWKPLESP